jgi:phosphohistidine phosphatase
MRLLLIRHGIAVPRGTRGVPEDERPLTKRGIRRFREAARGLATIMRRPDAVLTSPLLRARQTADIAAEAWGKVEPVDVPALAGGTFEQVADVLAQYPIDAVLAVVGHEPDLSSHLARLLGTPHEARLTFRKGGAALVEVPGSPAEGGALIWYLSPRLLRRLGA